MGEVTGGWVRVGGSGGASQVCKLQYVRPFVTFLKTS